MLSEKNDLFKNLLLVEIRFLMSPLKIYISIFLMKMYLI